MKELSQVKILIVFVHDLLLLLSAENEPLFTI